MRRSVAVMSSVVAAGLLVLSACSSGSGARNTVTAVVTVSSGAEVPSSGAAGSDSAAPGSDAPSGSAAPGSQTSASGSAAPSSAAQPTGPVVTVDPLKADCGSLLNAADVKRVLGTDIPNDRLKVNVAEVNANVGQVGRVRCLYGLSEDKKSGQVTLALTTYKDAASAQQQVKVTTENESNQGGTVSSATVGGYPASIAVRDGGLLVMSYDTWTLAIAVPASVDQTTLTTTLPQLGDAVLSRLLKS